ncbi:hypothetical protein NL676_000220 [Syzygium grande]|nr:hypothetical protein NL676_000220 [Syzygium grande]
MHISLPTHPPLRLRFINPTSSLRGGIVDSRETGAMGGCGVQTRTLSLRLVSTMMMTATSLLFLGAAEAAVDCATVTALVSTCSAFIAYGTPDPYRGRRAATP